MRKALGRKLDIKAKRELGNKVGLYIQRLSGSKINEVTQKEIEESEELAYSLFLYFQNTDLNSLIFWPSFIGCGRLNSCKGDIVLENKLIEVKAGERHFRLIDVRQVITYLALNFCSKKYKLQDIALLNPRTGLVFETSVSILIESCSGRRPVDVFSDIVDFVSTEINSK
jgi:hypothetical protein